MNRATRQDRQRGSASVALLVALALLQLGLVGALLVVRRDQDLVISRLDSERAFYAAEAGANMAIRELMLNADEDGDGAVGSISDDGDPENDPQLGPASFTVTISESELGQEIVSVGRAGGATRAIRVTLD